MQITMSNFFLKQNQNLIVALYAVKPLNESMITVGRQLKIFLSSSSIAIWFFTKDVMSAPVEKNSMRLMTFCPDIFKEPTVSHGRSLICCGTLPV